MRPLWILVAITILIAPLAGCGPTETVEEAPGAEQTTAATESATTTNTNTIEISFWGLTAFMAPTATDSSAWAFLVDANYECDTNGNLTGTLPPGVMCTTPDRPNDYPPHQAWLVYDNASIQNCELGEPQSFELHYQDSYDAYPLAGKEVQVTLAGPLTVDLQEHVSSDEIQRGNPSFSYEAASNLKTGPLQNLTLASRVKITPDGAGSNSFSMTARPVPLEDGTYRAYKFYYEQGGATQVLQMPGGADVLENELGEETLLTSTTASEVVIRIGSDECTFSPASTSAAMQIWIVNSTPNPMRNDHWKAFRWYYHLAPSADPDYYPVPVTGETGGRRCPELELNP